MIEEELQNHLLLQVAGILNIGGPSEGDKAEADIPVDVEDEVGQT